MRNIVLHDLDPAQEYVLARGRDGRWRAIPFRHRGMLITELGGVGTVTGEPAGARPRTHKLPANVPWRHPLDKAEQESRQ